MRTKAAIAALDQIEAPAIRVVSGIYDIAPEREEIELIISAQVFEPVKGKGGSDE